MTLFDFRAGLRVAAAVLLLASPGAALAKGHGHAAAPTSGPPYQRGSPGVISNMKIISCPPNGDLSGSMPPATGGWVNHGWGTAMHLASVKVQKLTSGGETLTCWYEGPNGVGIYSDYTQNVTMSCTAAKNQFSCF